MKKCKLKVPCRHCQSAEGVIIVPTGNLHPAKVNCAKCGAFHKWLGKADLELAESRNLVNDLAIPSIPGL